MDTPRSKLSLAWRARDREGNMKILMTLLSVALLAACTAKAPEGSFTPNESGVIVTPAAGAAKRVRLQVRADGIIRVTAVADETADAPESLMVVATGAAPTEFNVSEVGGDVLLKTARLIAHVSLATGAVTFTDANGKPLLEEAPARTIGGSVSQRFNPGTDEAFYGMG